MAPTTTLAVHLVRHGESTWNIEHRVQGQSPLAGGLSEAGRHQAFQLSAELRNKISAPQAVRLVSSDLRRAVETAAVLAEQLACAVQLDERLREQRLGALEGRLATSPAGEAPAPTVAEVIRSLWQRPGWHPPGDGESVEELGSRSLGALEELAEGARGAPALVLVTHGGWIRSVLARLAGEAAPPVVANASCTTLLLDGSAGSVQLAATTPTSTVSPAAPCRSAAPGREDAME